MEVRSYKGIGTPTIAGRTISGYAIVFNSQSQIMIDYKESRSFREVIKNENYTEKELKDFMITKQINSRKFETIKYIIEKGII